MVLARDHRESSHRAPSGVVSVAYFYTQSHWHPVTPLGFAATVEWMQRSPFCLCPPGDVPYNKRYFTALLAGCIPVLFAPEQDRLWPLHWGGWRDASRVMLDTRRATAEPSYVGDALRAIPASAVDAMRATIHKRAGAFRYSLEDVRGDAVHVLLRGVAAAA